MNKEGLKSTCGKDRIIPLRVGANILKEGKLRGEKDAEDIAAKAKQKGLRN